MKKLKIPKLNKSLKLIFIIVIAVTLALVSIMLWSVFRLAFGPDPLSICLEKWRSVPADEESCKAEGGEWNKFDLFGETKEECNIPTLDAGKECKSQDECEGCCIAHRSGKRHINEGECSSSKIVRGCLIFIDHGKNQEVCVD